MQLKTYNEMDYKEFERLVWEHVPHPPYITEFNFTVSYESSNDVSHVFAGIKGADYLGHGAKEITEFAASELPEEYGWPSAYDLLEYLAHHGHIPDGDYLITVSW